MSNELTYHSAANTGDTVYAHVENMTGQVWNGSAFEAPVSANWATYDIAMTEQGTSTGIFRGDMPAAAAGAYLFIVRKQAGGSPVVGDIVLGSSPSFDWDGSVVVTLISGTPVDGKSVQAALRIIAAAVVGKTSGAGTGEEAFLGLDGATTRATVSVDEEGERSAVTYV